jgi:acyltransferase family protein
MRQIPAEFDDIRPYADHEVREQFEVLLHDRLFMRILRGFVPLPAAILRAFLRLTCIGVSSALGFQKRYMYRVMEILISRTTRRLTFDHSAIPSHTAGYTFISNHRDIVLDSAFLDVRLIKAGFPNTVQIAIGDNLLVYPWIERFVRMNKAFIVRRSVGKRELLEASRHMSRYMHWVIAGKDDNIWIAQREGRAKDSSDHTQPSVLRMMALGGEGSAWENLRDMHLVPLTISYEYDPCDYLKAKEFQLKRDNPAYKKTKQEDLDNMRTGIMGKKGRVHYCLAPCADSWIEEYKALSDKEMFEAVAARIDREIHARYRLYPGNYIAADLLESQKRFAEHYSESDVRTFEHYLTERLALIELPEKDETYLRKCLLTMYANPLYNYLKAHEQ